MLFAKLRKEAEERHLKKEVEKICAELDNMKVLSFYRNQLAVNEHLEQIKLGTVSDTTILGGLYDKKDVWTKTNDENADILFEKGIHFRPEVEPVTIILD